MRKATAWLTVLLLVSATSALGQVETEFYFDVPLSEDYWAPYSQGEDGGGVHSGARGVAGPYDLDGDGLMEVLVTDYTNGGRVHVIENTGVDAWEHVYSTPPLDSTASTSNGRFVQGADLDSDGMGEILFLAGHAYGEANELPLGLYVFENTGADNDYGEEATIIVEIESGVTGTPASVVSEQFAVADVDGDGEQEILIPGNSSNDWDIFYIYSVTGDIGSGFEVFTLEAELNPRTDSDTYGGGSPYAIHPADLDGDGTLELSYHSWNSFNFFNVDIAGANDYVFPEVGSANPRLQATAPDDHVSLFGGVVIDVNGDGDDEVFYPRFQAGNVAILNYEDGEDVTQITADNLVLDVIPSLTSLGITAGDLDQDGNVGIIGSGPSYGAGSIGNTPSFIRIAEYIGGDVEDPASYVTGVLEDFWRAADTLRTNFDLIQRDSAGVMSEYYEETAYSGKDRAGGQPGQGPLFASKLAFLGDADGDGKNELAVAFQGVDDSTYVIQETFNPDDSTYTRVILDRMPNENRSFLRIVEADINAVATEDRAETPNGFVLHQNYPNPFNPTTSIRFTLPSAAQVTVRVYDVMGRLVQTLVRDQAYPTGTHQITWDGTNAAGDRVASGTYLYTLEHGTHRQSRPMLLIK